MEEIFQNFSPKNVQNRFLGPKMAQKTKNRKFFAIFFGRNRFRMVQNVFINENIDFENFYRLKFFQGHSRFLNGNYMLFGEHASNGKGKCIYDSLKSSQYHPKISVESFGSIEFG